MTARRYLPVSIPELAEPPSVYDWNAVLAHLRMIAQRGTIAPNGEDANPPQPQNCWPTGANA